MTTYIKRATLVSVSEHVYRMASIAKISPIIIILERTKTTKSIARFHL
jgi:hypothetical protein